MRKSMIEEYRLIKRALKMLESGSSNNAIAKELGMHRSTVAKVRAEWELTRRASSDAAEKVVAPIEKPSEVRPMRDVPTSRAYRVGETVRVSGVERVVARVYDDGTVDVTIGSLGRRRVTPDG